ncbi:hypothetical protein M9435_004229 [Picochlorum sp. BPE23]|nr:hypothetical protein M9435_004229 [Picochlorum sp. BPE23]
MVSKHILSYSAVICALHLICLLPCIAGGRHLLQDAAQSFTFCLPLQASDYPNIVQKCNDAFALVQGSQITCMAAGSIDGCVAAINNGQADFTKMGPSDAFIANREYGLEPLLTEYYGGDAGNSYYGVAVVRKEFCVGNQVTLADLKGTRSCHTGYRKTSGWTIPVGFMTDNGIMEVVNNDDGVPNDVETVASFFSQTCAPGSEYSQLCTACGGDCSESNDPYADYDGSVRGLMEDACDVAFTKQSIVPTVASDGSDPASWATLKMDDLRLVCPLGGCRAVSDWKTCNLAAIPSQAFMGPASLPSSAGGKALISSLDAAGQDSAFINAAKNIDGSEEILTDKTERLDPVSEGATFINYLGQETRQAYLGIEQLEPPESGSQTTGGSLRFCLPLQASDYPNIVQKCNDAFALVQGSQITCMAAGSIDGCVAAINNGRADFTKMGPSDAFIANREYGLEPLLTEYYGGDAGNSYYGVAVVRKEFCDGNQVTLADLKGTRSCHTGYRKTSGWTIPVGFMTDNGIMEVVNNDDGVPNDVETVASFFSQTCAPGSEYSQLCTACGGDCSESNDPYADYDGSVRGLMEDACDVAFTKQSIVPTVASDGSDPASWATLKMDDLRLVCPLGGCRAVSDWKTCNLAAIPSQAFMGPVSLPRSAKGKALISSLDAAGRDAAFINAAKDIDGSEEILTGNTLRLDPISESTSFIDYLGRGTSQAYLGIEQLQASASSSGSDGLSGGAIAGIVIGCLAGVALIAGAGFFIWKKKKGTGSSSYGEFKGSAAVNPLTI